MACPNHCAAGLGLVGKALQLALGGHVISNNSVGGEARHVEWVTEVSLWDTTRSFPAAVVKGSIGGIFLLPRLILLILTRLFHWEIPERSERMKAETHQCHQIRSTWVWWRKKRGSLGDESMGSMSPPTPPWTWECYKATVNIFSSSQIRNMNLPRDLPIHCGRIGMCYLIECRPWMQWYTNEHSSIVGQMRCRPVGSIVW